MSLASFTTASLAALAMVPSLALAHVGHGPHVHPIGGAELLAAMLAVGLGALAVRALARRPSRA